MRELDISALTGPGGTGERETISELVGAIDLASDQDTGTWLTDDGKRIAAIVPVDVAEQAEADMAAVLATPLGRHRAGAG